jgi:hypothetical protein
MSIDAVANMVHVFFSEDVMTGTGTVIAGAGVSTPVTHSNVTVSGFKLSLSVYAGALSSANTYDLQITPGSLKDASGNLFLGLNGSSMQYTTANADVTAPALISQQPPHETTPTFGLPVTASMMLEFSEAVQAAPGATAAILTPVYGYKKIEIPTADVYIDQAKVMLTGSTMMPG